jgi:NAD(P)-dependent dehydrogenase (short-subunit alcohol dehydrogenase family)
MYEDLKGKTALITGSGKKTGMGYGIAEKLASHGTNVIISDLGKQAGKDDRSNWARSTRWKPSPPNSQRPTE